MHLNDEPQVMALIQYAVFPEPQSDQPPVPATDTATDTAAVPAWQVRDVESLGTDSEFRCYYSPGTIRAVDGDLGHENLDDRHGPHRGI